MAELKTKPNDADVDAFIDAVEDEQRRADCRQVAALMAEVTGQPPVMWGTAIVGFGSYDYTYASGRTGTWAKVGFSPRKKNLTLYFSDGFDRYGELLGRLGPHTTGKSCLYVKRLSDLDADVLREMIDRSYRFTSS